jgi:hypothetical protein
MSIMDTLWPWKALSKLQRENRLYMVRYAEDRLDIDTLNLRIKSLESEASGNRIRISLQKDEIMRLNEKLKTAVLRDPKTGRMAKLPKE